MDTMHTSFKGLLGLREDAEAAEARMTADEHRQAHAYGLARLRGRVGTAGGTRALRRQRERNQRREQTTATRRYRRDQIQELQDRSTALGLARVYLQHAGNVDMYANVRDHVARLCREIAEQRHPEVFQEDDTLSPEEALRAKAVALDEAHTDLVARFQEVLDGH